MSFSRRVVALRCAAPWERKEKGSKVRVNSIDCDRVDDDDDHDHDGDDAAAAAERAVS